MLYVPLVVGTLVAATFSWRLILLGLSVTFLFIARESLLVWWRGRSRGLRLPAARRMMLIDMGLAAASGAPLVLFAKLYWLVPLAARSAARPWRYSD
jgi:hypothetical protein